MNRNRIKLVNCDAKILNILIHDESSLAKHLGVHVMDQWTEFGQPMFVYALEQITLDPASQKWWTYLPIEIDSNTIIGSCGFKGIPDASGSVEIGYEIAVSQRNQGYATEVVQKLISLAFENNQVRKILAHTLANKNASTRVLSKCGFSFVEEVEDDEDGLIWKWELSRPLV